MTERNSETTKKIITKLNELLEAERSAAESYQKALSRIEADSVLDELMLIRQDHHASVQTLSDQIVKYGGEPTQSSGTWGIFARTIMDTVKFLGDKTAIAALRAGEQHGLKKYQSLLQDDKTPALVRRFVSQQLILKQMGHVTTLQLLEKQAS